MKHRDEIEKSLADIIDTYIDDKGNAIDLTPKATIVTVDEVAKYHIFHLTDITFTPDEITILGLTPVHIVKE